MKNRIMVFLLVNIFCILSCSNKGKESNQMPPGEYDFSCGTGISYGNSETIDWSPINQYKTGPLRYRVKNDSIIEVGNKNPVAGSTNRTLVKVNFKTDALEYQKLPKQYLDFVLAGVYQEAGHPSGYYSVLYYSKKRYALLKQYQVGLNNIDVAVLYFENATDTSNPFKNYSQFFKLGDYLNFRDTTTMKIK